MTSYFNHFFTYNGTDVNISSSGFDITVNISRTSNERSITTNATYSIDGTRTSGGKDTTEPFNESFWAFLDDYIISIIPVLHKVEL